MSAETEALLELMESAAVVASGELYAGPARVRSLVCRAAAGAGTIVLRDGGVTGKVKLTINTPAAAGSFSVPIPGGGIVFKTDVYAVLTTADGVTAFFRPL
jgi:hypothetical protein